VKTFREHLLTEALLAVDKQDINKLYAPYAKPFKEFQAVWNKYSDEQIKNNLTIRRDMMLQFREIFSRYPQNAPLKVFSSSDLKSELARKAHAVNPITIYVFLTANGNYYNPLKHIIYLSLDTNIANAMENILDSIPVNQLAMLKSETTDLRMKTTIMHEIAHWLDNSLHNFYMSKAFSRAADVADRGRNGAQVITKSLYRGESDPYLSPMEVTAMVNQVAELKRRLPKKKWDQLTWVDLMHLIPSLHFADRRLGAEFRKRMISRMSREHLVGASLMKQLK
jgi:predicted XRE-type DNA-binding protein